MVNLCQHREITTTKRTMFQNTIGGIKFIMTSIDSGTFICSEQHKRDSSEKRTVLRCARLRRICSWHYRSHSARWCAVRTLRRTGHFARRPAWRRLIMVWEEIWLGVEVVVLNPSRMCINYMYKFWVMCLLSVGLTLVCHECFMCCGNAPTQNLLIVALETPHMSDNIILIHPCM